METKTRATLTTVVLLLLLAGGLAWKFWPMEKSVQPASANALKVVDISKPKPPILGSAVELPKMAPAKPGSSSAEASVDNAEFSADYATKVNMFQQAKMEAETAGPEPAAVSDLGEVNFTNGVPQELTLSDGTSVTATATILPNDVVRLRLQAEQHGPDGNVIGRSTMSVTTSSTGHTMTMTMGGSQGRNTIKITPHVN